MASPLKTYLLSVTTDYPNTQSRYISICNEIENMAREFGVKNEPQLRIRHIRRISSDIAHAHITPNNYHGVWISPLIIIDMQDIPKHLRVEHYDDIRLKDDEFLQQYIQKIHDVMNSVFRLSTDGSYEKEELRIIGIMIRTLLIIQQDKHKFRQVFRSIIGHELGHIYHQHGKEDLVNSHSQNTSILTRIISSSKVIFEYLFRFESRRNEREADLFMVDNLGVEGIEGSRFFFKMAKLMLIEMRDLQDQSYNTWLLRYVLINMEGEFLLHTVSHGSFSSRLKVMEDHLEQRGQAYIL